MIQPTEIEQMIKAAIPDALVTATDTTGTNDHFYIEVSSSKFNGMPLIAQHQLVLGVLKDEMDRRIHAVQIKTKAR